jgi:hypothetical protein
MDRLMAADTDLLQDKFTLAQIAADPNLVEKKIREHSSKADDKAAA